MNVKRAKTAGFCFGVKRAVETVYEQAKNSDAAPIYTYGPIIHNEEVVKDLENQGVIVLRTEQELEQLNEVYGRAYEFSFTFSEPEVDGTGVRRNIAVYCEAENYDAAAELMRQILQGPYRSMIHDVSINSMARALANQMADLKKGRVSLSFNMTYYETTVGADSLEGLPVEETQQAQADGLANSDLSDLQRSDLETAAEAALGE